MLNACNMMRDWSKDRFPYSGSRPEKSFGENPGMNQKTSIKRIIFYSMMEKLVAKIAKMCSFARKMKTNH